MFSQRAKIWVLGSKGLGRTEHSVHLLSLSGSLSDAYMGPWPFSLQNQVSAQRELGVRLLETTGSTQTLQSS